MKMKNRFRIVSSSAVGVNQLGFQATRGDFGLFEVGAGFPSRKAADAFAETRADWQGQFDDTASFLVCTKKPHRGWVVVAQYNSH